MQRLRYLLAAGLMSASFGAAAALVAGKDYVTLNTPQPASTEKCSIEVLEVFSYGCTYCYDLFKPTLANWLKKQPGYVSYSRLPATFYRESWTQLARAYYALEALGALDRVHPLLFEAVRTDKALATDQNALVDWVGKQGIDQQAFRAAIDSPGVQAKMEHAAEQIKALQVEGVPAIIVAGKYRVTPDMTVTHKNLLRVVDELVAQERKEQGCTKLTCVPAKPKKKVAKATAQLKHTLAQIKQEQTASKPKRRRAPALPVCEPGTGTSAHSGPRAGS